MSNGFQVYIYLSEGNDCFSENTFRFVTPHARCPALGPGGWRRKRCWEAAAGPHRGERHALWLFDAIFSCFFRKKPETSGSDSTISSRSGSEMQSPVPSNYMESIKTYLYFRRHRLTKLAVVIPVPYWYIFWTMLPVAKISGNDRPLVSNIWGAARWREYICLGGGFNCFLFSALFGKIPILTNTFQVGWDHQPVVGLFQFLWNFRCICIDSRFFLLWFARFSHIREAFEIEDSPDIPRLNVPWTISKRKNISYISFLITTLFGMFWLNILNASIIWMILITDHLYWEYQKKIVNQRIPIHQNSLSGWWQLKHVLEFSPQTLGFHDPIWLAHIFQIGWNHQPING